MRRTSTIRVPLAPAVERIAQKHVGLNILPEHYPHVTEAQLGVVKDVLG
jgi:nitric oxide dioxygenase